MSSARDAWEDDWVNPAEKSKSQQTNASQPLSRSERKVQHAQANKQLWDAAERPERSYFLETKNAVPLKDEYKPQVKVLSRKPQVVPRASMNNGDMSNLSLQDDEDSEEEARRKNAENLAERQRKAAIEREEKQRKYAEVRERLFGSGKMTDSDGAQAASKSPAGRDSRQSSRRGRGGAARGVQPASSTEQSPARISKPTKQLYDPASIQRPSEMSRTATPSQERPIRQPRGPEVAGRGGFGFAARDGKNTV